MAKNATNKHTTRFGPAFVSGVDPPGWFSAMPQLREVTLSAAGYPIRNWATAGSTAGVISSNSSSGGLTTLPMFQVLGLNEEAATPLDYFRMQLGGQVFDCRVSGAGTIIAGTFLYLGTGVGSPGFAVSAGNAPATFVIHGRHGAFAIANETHTGPTAGFIKAILLPWRV